MLTPVKKPNRMAETVPGDWIEVGIGKAAPFKCSGPPIYSKNFDECKPVLVRHRTSGDGMMCHLTADQYSPQFKGVFDEMVEKNCTDGLHEYDVYIFNSGPMEPKQDDLYKRDDVKVWQVNSFKVMDISFDPKKAELVTYSGGPIP